MVDVRVELTEEEYDKLLTMNVAELTSWVEENKVPETVSMGYGFYGSSLPLRDENGYYICYYRGDCCD